MGMLPSEAVRLSAIAYESYSTAKALASGLGYDVKRYYDVDNSQAYLFENEYQCVLTFRGTEFSKGRLGDIASNIRVAAREWAGPGKVHLGYANQYVELRDKAFSFCDMVPDDKPLIATGHSMGGAMATICAADLYARGWKLSELITFGSPKAIDAEAASYIKCPVTRFTNRSDFAPWYPPSFNLTHPTKATKITSYGWLGPITRHMPDKYIKAVDNYMEFDYDY